MESEHERVLVAPLEEPLLLQKRGGLVGGLRLPCALEEVWMDGGPLAVEAHPIALL